MGLTHILCCLIGLDLLSLIFTAGYYFIVIQFSENMYLGIAIFTALLVELAAATEKSPIVQISDRESALVIENGYVKLTFDKTAASISELYADFSGLSLRPMSLCVLLPFLLHSQIRRYPRVATVLVTRRKELITPF